MAFRDYSNNDRFDPDRRGYRADSRDFDGRSDWGDEHDRAEWKYRHSNWRDMPEERGHGTDSERHDYFRPPFGTVRGYTNNETDPYIRDQRRLRERGELQYGRDYGYADRNYYYHPHDRRGDSGGRDYPRDREYSRDRDDSRYRDDRYYRNSSSENLDAQLNYERDRPNFRGGGWDQGEPMRSRHSQPGRFERDAFEADRGYRNEYHDSAARRAGRYTRDPNAWSSMEHDWNNDHYYGGGRNRTGDYGSNDEPYDWRDNFGKDRIYSRSGRGTTTGWTGGDRSLGSSDLGS